MVMAIDISISITPLGHSHLCLHFTVFRPSQRAKPRLTLTLFRNDKMVDLIGTDQDALRYVRARRTPSPRARV